MTPQALCFALFARAVIDEPVMGAHDQFLRVIDEVKHQAKVRLKHGAVVHQETLWVTLVCGDVEMEVELRSAGYATVEALARELAPEFYGR